MLSAKNLAGQRTLDNTKISSDLHQGGTSSTVSTPHSSNHGPPDDASDGELMDMCTVTHGLPSESSGRVYAAITGPTSLGEAMGFQGQVYLVTQGNLACTRSKDATKWFGCRQGNPERLPLLTDDQRFNNHVRLESITLSTAFSIHKTFELYLNEYGSVYRHERSKENFEFTINLAQPEVNLLLKDIPDSVALIRCDLPFYLTPECKEIIEHIVVEYFRSPWTMQWYYRVRNALVQKPLPWYKSVAEEEDEGFPDYPLPNANGVNTQSPPASITPPDADQTPTTAVSPPASDVSMEIDTQSLATTVGFGDIASIQHNAVTDPSGALSLPGACSFLDQAQSSVNSAELTIGFVSGSNLEVTSATDTADTGDDDHSSSESMDIHTDEDDVFLSTNTQSFFEDPMEDHPNNDPESEPELEPESINDAVDSLSDLMAFGTDTNTAADNNVDSPLSHVAQEQHNNSVQPDTLNAGDTQQPGPNAGPAMTANPGPVVDIDPEPAAVIDPEPAVAIGSKSVVTADPESVIRVRCSFEGCIKSFSKQGGLDVHIKSHFPEERERCTFFPCTKTFAQYADRKRHENYEHKGELWVCDPCGRYQPRKPSVNELKAMDPCSSPTAVQGQHLFLFFPGPLALD
ncbi:hypothetical protein BG015_008328 [Linnemannia schmuckeri]|uniref:C2H2-type domain-containing protein n=1 Tax=Linnemannia schmuckeri TaxID=64567 RepID=A0A9P5S644_9FUNG|nr:hypothetical protein BG015_008328 [Linnemannia schmuckeri]